MRKTIFFFLVCCATQLFGQVNIQWEALPAQANSAAEIVYQTPQGFLFAQLPLAKKIMMSKDDAKTWETVAFQDSLPYYRFVSDKIGDIYCYSQKKIYKLDTSQNLFKAFLTIGGASYNHIGDVGFKSDKIYISTASELLIYDLNTLKVTFTKTYLNAGAYLILGKGNKNYIKTERSGLGAELKSFNDDGSNYTELGKKTELYYADAYALSSGKLILLKSFYLYVSEDEGATWQKQINQGFVDQLFVNSKNEIIIRRGTVMQSSSDEGKTWISISTPKNIFGNFYFLNNDTEKIVFTASDCYIKNFFLSKDKGTTWAEKSIALDKSQTIEILLTGENDVLSKSCTFFDEIKLHDKASWEKINILDSLDFSKVYILPSGKWMVRGWYSSIDGGQTVKAPNWYNSIDKGNTWQVHQSFPDSNSPNVDRNLNFNQLKQLLYVTFDKYYLSKDEGLTWEEFDSPNLYLGSKYPLLMHKDQIFFSTGTTFNSYNETTKEYKVINKINKRAIENISTPLLLKDDKIAFLAVTTSLGRSFLYISADFGVTFVFKLLPVEYGREVKDLLKGENNSLILLTYDNIYISYDEGSTWLSIKGDLPKNIDYDMIAISNDNLLYVGMKGAAIYKTKTSLSSTIKTKDAISKVMDFNLYPNPTTDELNIQIADNQDNVSNVLIYSIEGKLLQQSEFYGNSTSLNVQQLPQGIYLLQLKNGAKTTTKRFIKN
jgi:hypothetical protein